MRFKKAFFCFTFSLASAAQAQFTYVLDQSIPVEYNSVTLPMPWAGAFNSPQFNTMDLNGDNVQDLVIFDRTANKVIKAQLQAEGGTTVWLSLDKPGYGIHGTPKPEDVGRTESHGCFRLANWNAEYLLKLVSVGTPVFVEP